MSWIKTINYDDANAVLKRIYDRVKGPNSSTGVAVNNVDNILKAHSLRPHSLIGHMTLYKNVIHNSNNKLPKWYLESIGVYVSFINKCDYCVKHHYTGLKRLLNDDNKSDEFLQAVKNNTLENFFDKKKYLGLSYAYNLTLNLDKISENDILDMRAAGFLDGEILEINQVTSYFNYANRTVIGLGVNLKGDILGLSPNESADPNNWNHQ